MTRPIGVLLLTAVVIGLLPGAAPAQTSSTQARVSTTASSVNRFALIDTDMGVFLLDGSTGRVWRYTRLTAPESETKSILEISESLKKAELQRDLTADERAELLRTVKEAQDASVNPCKGTAACFLEVDRTRLSSSGWVSEVIKD